MFRAAFVFAIASLLVIVRGAVAQSQEPDDPVATSGRGPWVGLSEQLQAARLGEIRTDFAPSAGTFDAASATTTESSEAALEAAPECDEQKMAALNKAMAGPTNRCSTTTTSTICAMSAGATGGWETG
jgi:hypothetical protein